MIFFGGFVRITNCSSEIMRWVGPDSTAKSRNALAIRYFHNNISHFILNRRTHGEQKIGNRNCKNFLVATDFDDLLLIIRFRE